MWNLEWKLLYFTFDFYLCSFVSLCLCGYDLILKKQSQFSKEQIGAKSLLIMVYGILCGRRRRQNKPNSNPILGADDGNDFN